MINDKTVAVEHLAEVSPDELADVARDGRVFRMSCVSCVPNIESACLGVHSIVSCGPAHWHRAGEALQPSSPALARSANTKAREETHTSTRHHIDDASGRMEVKHETYATGPRDMITYSWDARIVDDMSQRIISSSCCTLTCGGGDLFFETGILLFTFVSPGRYIEHLAKGSTSSLPKDDSQGNRVEERLTPSSCSAATT
ncbi:hypothetical protein PTSG_02719 [Salpingoeca rosetta]|uniref:Uncharacterized protein n=1 Tax=Salpingoeca rosetta (strain ATCC 50818 / BSB-021) TaxID=946362 RepID=F2U338_SALR5|nr:uncharacterized protein PTSG_02719 [Salpingoeca rosetta]EGD82032.1 hypothetical protein PTSG_02719 [Salpingoeca rosetta]|eukprot:XP_004996215.1 hypothetical protein PTSG_02719 [Salpingoeca rosetta]